jgi:hypothetical protein
MRIQIPPDDAVALLLAAVTVILAMSVALLAE